MKNKFKKISQDTLPPPMPEPEEIDAKNQSTSKSPYYYGNEFVEKMQQALSTLHEKLDVDNKFNNYLKTLSGLDFANHINNLNKFGPAGANKIDGRWGQYTDNALISAEQIRRYLIYISNKFALNVKIPDKEIIVDNNKNYKTIKQKRKENEFADFYHGAIIAIISFYNEMLKQISASEEHFAPFLNGTKKEINIQFPKNVQNIIKTTPEQWAREEIDFYNKNQSQQISKAPPALSLSLSDLFDLDSLKQKILSTDESYSKLSPQQQKQYISNIINLLFKEYNLTNDLELS